MWHYGALEANMKIVSLKLSSYRQRGQIHRHRAEANDIGLTHVHIDQQLNNNTDGMLPSKYACLYLIHERERSASLALVIL